MKVTIITDGTTRIVLKPQTPAEILAVKELHSKEIVATHHESTQILAESSPNCLVLGANPNQTIPTESPTRMIILDERDASVVATYNQENVDVDRLGEIIAMECNFEDWEVEQTKKDVLTMRNYEGKNNVGELNFRVIKVNDY